MKIYFPSTPGWVVRSGNAAALAHLSDQKMPGPRVSCNLLCDFYICSFHHLGWTCWHYEEAVKRLLPKVQFRAQHFCNEPINMATGMLIRQLGAHHAAIFLFLLLLGPFCPFSVHVISRAVKRRKLGPKTASKGLHARCISSTIPRHELLCTFQFL